MNIPIEIITKCANTTINSLCIEPKILTIMNITNIIVCTLLISQKNQPLKPILFIAISMSLASLLITIISKI